jgi:hypothetical protein
LNNSLRRVNYPHAILGLGLALVLLVVMLRPSGAVADLPSRANVFVKYDDEDYAVVDISKLTQVTRDYDVVPSGKKNSVSSRLTGVPLVEFLRAVDSDLDGVSFVRVRLNTTDDSRLALVPLGDANAERPPLVLSSGKVGSRSLGTPSLVPGQPDSSEPIEQDNITGFSKSKPYIQIIPGRPGSKILNVRIDKNKRSDGQYNLSASIHNGSGSAAKYQWFQTDAKGNQALIGSGKSVTTTATGNKEAVVSVVVTETGTGSTGVQYMSFIPKSSDKGKTTNPGGSGSGSGGGTGSGSGGGGTPGGAGSIQTTPVPGYTPPTTPRTPSPQSTTPDFTPPTTPAPQPDASTFDTSMITNLAQNVTGVGGPQAVSGVLLTAPTVAPTGSGGGSPLSALPSPVATELNSIFKPVDGAEDAWAYLLAILLATAISGAVREWVRP